MATLSEVKEFYEFFSEKIGQEQTYQIIHYLQEHLGVIPSHYERCDECGELYDSEESGYYIERSGSFCCEDCYSEI